jgi:hypothetical protein
MSFSSRKRESSIPFSASEMDSSDESFAQSRNSFLSPAMTSFSRSSRPTPVKEFKESLENEKNIRKLMGRLDANDSSHTLGGDKIMDVLEKNYKLQIQTLLEEVNKLKLEKMITEKKIEKFQKDPKQTDRFRRGITMDGSFEDSNLKQALEVKNSTIKELEFQVSSFKNENITLKTRLEAQTRQISDLFQKLADSENLKEILEEKDQEISYLKESLDAEENKHDKIIQELSYLKNENIALKLRSQNNSFTQLPTGATSFLNPQCNCFSKDQSFFSVIDKFNGNGQQNRMNSEARMPVGGILNFSEINEESRNISPKAVHQGGISHRTVILSSRTMRDPDEEDFKPKSELNQLQRLSVKVLSEYERGLKTEKKTHIKKDSKTLDRIIEVNKIKSYYIEAQNKKLLSILNIAAEKDSDSGSENTENSKIY